MGSTHGLPDERARRVLLFEGGRQLLESMAQGAALPVVLDQLCGLVERVASGCHCTMLLIDPASNRMAHGAAPSVPDTYSHVIAGRPATAEFGPCGMAAASREQVIVADVATDERWTTENWRGLALAHGLRACWSTPVLSATGHVLATFALYWPTPRPPGHPHQDVIQQMTHIAAIAIERDRTAATLRSGDPTFGRPRRMDGLAAPGRPLDSPAPEVDLLRSRYASLTSREREVLTWVVAGLPNKRIAAELGTAEITVKVHRGRAIRKMGAASLADLVRMAIRLDVPLPVV